VALAGLVLALVGGAGACYRAYERDEQVTASYVDLEQQLRAGTPLGLTEADPRVYLGTRGLPCLPEGPPARVVCRSAVNVEPGHLNVGELIVVLDLDAGGRVTRTEVQRFRSGGAVGLS
jgi:hypothetical protein